VLTDISSLHQAFGLTSGYSTGISRHSIIINALFWGITQEARGSSASEPSDSEVQVVFCSRTHSQLSQFVGEVKRTVFAEELRMVTLGGRKQLCVNPVGASLCHGGRSIPIRRYRALNPQTSPFTQAVQALQSAVRMNERCLELQKAKPSKKAAKAATGNPNATKGAASKPVPKKAGGSSGDGGGCEYKKKAGAMRKLTDGILAQPMDIEELATQATSRSCCGYYAARAALPAAQLVRSSLSLFAFAHTRYVCV